MSDVLAKLADDDTPDDCAWQRLQGAQVLEPLLECTTLVCARWLLKHARSKQPPLPWQQVVTTPGAVAELHGMKQWQGGCLPVAALSYPWGSKMHPDPAGLRLQEVVPILSAIVQQCDLYGPQCTWGVMWDFSSLPQRGYNTGFVPDIVDEASGELIKNACGKSIKDDRTDEQYERFRRGLFGISTWYMHKHVVVIIMNTPKPEHASYTNLAPYQTRGWCNFEAGVSSINKSAMCRLELSRMPQAPTSSWFEILQACRKEVQQPEAPDKFGTRILSSVHDGEIVFTNGKEDAPMVVKLYRWGFIEACAAATLLKYDHLSWSDHHVTGLADTIAYCYDASRFEAYHGEDANVEKMKLLMLRGVESIDLSHNIIGNAGMLSLVRVLSMPGTFPNLRTLLLHVNQVGDTGCLALVALLRDGSKLPKLHAVSLGGNPDISDDCLDELGKVLEARVDPTPVPCVVL